MTDERERIAAELERVRERVRLGAPSGGTSGDRLPDARVEAPRPIPARSEPPPPPPNLVRPDNAHVNALWEARSPVGGGVSALADRLRSWLVAPFARAQVAFNSRQVQLDNETLEYLDARFDATHRHYDAVLGIHGGHMDEIDQRHLILQEELVAHVHDLVRRIDLVLSEGEQGRLGLEWALRDVRTRLEGIEHRLRER